MQPHAASGTRIQQGFGPLPAELLLNVLDQLVAPRNGRTPIAYGPSDPTTKALHALALVSRTTYICASKYLYTHCLYIDTTRKHSCLRRTLGLDLGNHPLALAYGQAGRNDELFNQANIPHHITSLFLSPIRSKTCGIAPLIRLPQVIDLCLAIGHTLKRLAVDFQPIYVPGSERIAMKPFNSSRNIFLHMTHLEELVCSYDTSDFFPYPPPNLKRLAMTSNDMEPSHLDFCFMISSLETLFLLRPVELGAAHIEDLFRRYNGRHLDVVFVDVNDNHITPRHTRDWEADDRVTVWEADVPKSYYGDVEELLLCDGWMWSHGVQGTLWGQAKRRMKSWSEVERLLAAAAP